MDFNRSNRKELQNFIKFMLSECRRLDAFCFLEVENEFGDSQAIEMNVEVWNRMGKLITREIKKRFSIKQEGLEGFVEVLKYHPRAIISGYEIDIKDQEVFISVPHCPLQEARLKRGVGEYSCKNMHGREFESIAKEVDKNINIECLFAPPDPHPKEFFCKWRFTIGG